MPLSTRYMIVYLYMLQLSSQNQGTRTGRRNGGGGGGGGVCGVTGYWRTPHIPCGNL